MSELEYTIYIAHTSADETTARTIAESLKELKIDTRGYKVKPWLMEDREEINWDKFYDIERSSAIIVVILSGNISEKSEVWEELKIAYSQVKKGIPCACLIIGGGLDDVVRNTAHRVRASSLQVFDYENAVGDVTKFCKDQMITAFRSGVMIPDPTILKAVEEFQGRDALFKLIDERFEKSNVVILTGIQGCGKKTLAREYVLRKNEIAKKAGGYVSCKEVSYVDLECSRGVDEDVEYYIDYDKLFELITTSYEERRIYGENKDFFRCRKNIMLQTMSENNYVILTDWETDLNELKEELCLEGCKLRFIVASSHEEPGCEKTLPIVNVDNEEIQRADSVPILRAYWPASQETGIEDRDIEQFAEFVGYHTYTLKHIGQGMQGRKFVHDGSVVTNLKDLRAAFGEVEQLSLRPRSLVSHKDKLLRILRKLIGMELEKFADSTADEKMMFKETLALLSLFDPKRVRGDILKKALGSASGNDYGNSIARHIDVEWALERMSYVDRTEDGSLSINPLVSEVAYSYMLDGDISPERFEQLTSVFLNYISELGDICTQKSTRLYMYVSTAEVDINCEEAGEVCRNCEHAVKRRRESFHTVQLAEMLFRRAFLSDNKEYYLQVIRYAKRAVEEDGEAASFTVLRKVANLMLPAVNNFYCGKREFAEKMSAAIEYCAGLHEFVATARGAEEALMLGKIDAARELYAEALVLCSEQQGDEREWKGIHDEMERYCKSSAPYIEYERRSKLLAALIRKRAADNDMSPFLGKVINELRGDLAHIKDEAYNAAVEYANKAGSSIRSVRERYICYDQAAKLMRLAGEAEMAVSYEKWRDDIAADTDCDLGDIRDEEIEEI